MEFLNLADPVSPVLVVVAHPDDIDFGYAGTVAALTSAGAEVIYAIATSGEAGPPEDMDRAEVKAMREREQRAAAAAVGVSDVRFLGQPDGHLVADLSLRQAISRVIRQVRPNLVITQSPERRYDRIYASHPDHLAVAEATVAAVYPDARNPHAHVELLRDEGLEPHAVDEVWVGSLEPPDVFIDITAEIDRKIGALQCHESQTSAFDVGALLRDWAAAVVADNGGEPGRLAEAFRRIRTA